MREGSSATILYATRLALRVGLYARYLLSPEARGARGLALTEEVRRELAEASDRLRGVVERTAMPVLQAPRPRPTPASPHLASPRLTSPHLASPRLTSPDLA